ncbi:MAG: indole-3-glycerol phosphate synthase TrpC [Planctomycetes bacterium]|nr:indole-3-glycerol phosphate synthase TrpC [Planctomycetota bacterium]
MILDEIVQNKRVEVERAKQATPLSHLDAQVALVGPARPFAARLRGGWPPFHIIAEMKKASPSAGVLCPAYDPAAIARAYEAHGASGLSILTDEKYFRGGLADLVRAREAASLPALRKDFTIDAFQVHEARAAGADCVLLIVRILSCQELSDFLVLAKELGMDALAEAHTEGEIEAALEAGAGMIGINNRDLDSLTVSLATTERLRRRIPTGPTVVSESGIKTSDDIRRLRDWGVDAALVGESLLRNRDPGAALAALVQACL